MDYYVLRLHHHLEDLFSMLIFRLKDTFLGRNGSMLCWIRWKG